MTMRTHGAGFSRTKVHRPIRPGISWGRPARQQSRNAREKVDAGTLRGMVPRINRISSKQRKVDAMALAERFEQGGAMAIRCRRIAAAAGIAAAVSAWPAWGYFDHYLSGTIVGTLGQAQLNSAWDVFGKTMDQSADGASVAFSLPADQRHRAVEGSFTPLQTRTDRGDACRQVRSEFRRAGQSESWTGWYCKEQGGWKSRKLPD